MLKTVVTLTLCSALYGFSIGTGHSLKFALRNIVKFPLLLLVTAAICCIAYYLAARSFTVRFRFHEIQHLVLEIFRDSAALLASLSPVFLFLSYTTEKPDGQGLCDYPMYLGLNIFFIAVCGSCSVVRQAYRLFKRHSLSPRRSAVIVLSWMAVSMIVGCQWAWYLRPFCGVADVDAPFMLGAEPDFRGDTNFYQAVYHLIDSPTPSGYVPGYGGK
jgi:hypothetical protein